MKVFFLRHATAEDRGLDLSDGARRLTEHGRAEAKAAGEGMKALGLRFDAILTSPLVRARETVELAVAGLGAGNLVREERRLASGARFGDVCSALEGLGSAQRVLLVGHEPDFSEAIAAFIGGGRIRMKKGAVACVHLDEVAADGGELRWLLLPEQFAGMRLE